MLTQQFNWRWNLYINVFIAIAAIILATVFVTAGHRSGPRPKLDIPGTILVSGALFSLVYGFSNAESDGWDSPLTWGFLAASGVLLIAFVLWQRRATHPLLPLPIVLDRNRGASYSSILIAGSGMFGIFLFVTYYLETTLKFTPIQTGLAFLPMIVMLVIAAQFSTNLFLPKFGPKVMVPIGMVIAGSGMLLLTRLGVTANYGTEILPALMVMGVGMGSIMPPAIQTATLGVDRHFAGVASALVNTSQQVGGSIGTALLNTLAATALTDYLSAHLPPTPHVLQEAAVHSYSTAYWWSAGFFAFGAVLSALLYRRRRPAVAEAAPAPAEADPVAIH